jgi:hypothetical protein
MKKKKTNEASLHANSSKIVNINSQVSAGSKRKADFSEDNDVEDDVVEQTSNSNPRTKRRKRRKNHTIEGTTHLA